MDQNDSDPSKIGSPISRKVNQRMTQDKLPQKIIVDEIF